MMDTINGQIITAQLYVDGLVMHLSQSKQIKRSQSSKRNRRDRRQPTLYGTIHTIFYTMTVKDTSQLLYHRRFPPMTKQSNTHLHEVPTQRY